MLMTDGAENQIDGLLLIAKGPSQVQVMQRVLSKVGCSWIAQVDSIREADAMLSQACPEVLLIDTAGMSAVEYLARLEPFVLTLPRKIKIFLVSPEPTVENVLKASEIGVDGILKSISSHYSISTMMQKLRKSQLGTEPLEEPSFAS